MALTDEQQKELEEKHAKLLKELDELKAKQAAQTTEIQVADGGGNTSNDPPKEKPKRGNPDYAKSIAELEAKIAKVEERLGPLAGTTTKPTRWYPNFFET